MRKPVLGVLPYIRDHGIAEEDAVALDGVSGLPPADPDRLDVAVVRLPRIANFDDFDPLREEPGVHLRWVMQPAELSARPDLLILPGTKATIADLDWLRRTGLGGAILRLAADGLPVLGICGGYQMLGHRLRDPDGLESPVHEAAGLGLLPIETVFGAPKTTRRVLGRVEAQPAGPLAGLAGTAFGGYEIHLGQFLSDAPPAFTLQWPDGEHRPEGAISADGLVIGTAIHGLLVNDALRARLLTWLAERKGLAGFSAARLRDREARYDRLAGAIRAHLDLDRICAIAGLPEATATVAGAAR